MTNKKVIILGLSLAIIFGTAGFFIKKVRKELRFQVEFPSEVRPQKLVNTKDIKYELIMIASSSFEKDILKPNVALLITDKEEIKADAEMFLAKPNMAHLCGHHYRILFWTYTDSLFGVRYVNKECEFYGYKPEEAREKVTHYAKKLETAPTHYIYNLEIPVSIEPNEIRKKLKDSELKLFFIDGVIRFPSIRFSYEHFSQAYLALEKKSSSKDRDKAIKENEIESRKIFKELVEKVKSASSVVSVSDIYYYSSYYWKGHIDVWFEMGTDFSSAVTILEQAGAKIEYKNTPTTYRVQVVDTSADIKEIKRKLKPYPIVMGIAEYTR